jgi:A/G-specific adenine glycosylase
LDVFFNHVDPVSGLSFRRALRSWYRKNARDLPWRRTVDPYAILVSEFMLQQTQVTTVIPFYEEWLRRFRDIGVLAAASEPDVLRSWQGLGYYTRARNLRTAAIVVMEKHHGRFPRSVESIRDLPGVGRYTANAVATFAFDQSVPIVDANIARVLSRLFDLQTPIDTSAGRAALWAFASQLLPCQNAGTYNSALMELGALVCGTRPKCGICPVKQFCRATDPIRLPRKRPRPSLVLMTERHAFVINRQRVLLEQSTKRWRGMWMLPRVANGTSSGAALYRAEFPFTHHRITLAVFPGHRPSSQTRDQRWFAVRDLSSIPVPTPHRRALNALLSKPGRS